MFLFSPRLLLPKTELLRAFERREFLFGLHFFTRLHAATNSFPPGDASDRGGGDVRAKPLGGAAEEAVFWGGGLVGDVTHGKDTRKTPKVKEVTEVI